ncbi:hypothetical protein L6R52_13725 [Myxococcota bacterium]|nr:hypothetical protein [Myxococcota bacterium]
MDRRSLLASSTLLLAVIVLLRLQGLFHGPVDVDETDLSTIAQMVRDGAVLYADVAEKKPPLGYYFYVPFAPLGWALWPVQLAAMVWLWATCLVVRRAAEAHTGRPEAGVAAAWACALASACNVLSVNLELMLNLPAAVALLAHVLAERARDEGEPYLRWDFATGAAIAIAAGFKHQAGILLVAIGLAIVIDGLRGARGGLARLVLLGVGFAVPGALMLGAFAATGHVDAFLEWNLERNFLYISLGAGSVLRRAVEGTLLFVVVGAPLYWFLAIRELGNLRALIGRPGWLGFALSLWLTWIPVSLGGRFYGHYFLQLAVPLALVVGPALADLWARRPLLAPVRRALVTALVLVPPIVFQVIGLGRAIAGDFPSQEPKTRELAAWLRANTRSDERLFVWGHFTPIYYLAQRLPGTRYPSEHPRLGKGAAVVVPRARRVREGALRARRQPRRCGRLPAPRRSIWIVR